MQYKASEIIRNVSLGKFVFSFWIIVIEVDAKIGIGRVSFSQPILNDL